MTRLRGSWTAAAAVTLFLLSACAQPTVAGAPGSPYASGSPSVPSLPGAGDDVVLRVAYTGGFVGPDALAGRLPATSVYADGRVIFEGPVPLSYPGPALPNLQYGVISPDTLRQLIAKAVAAGVKNGTDFGQPGVADAPTTEVTVVTAAGAQKAAAVALGEAQATDPQLTKAHQTARKKLRGFIAELDEMARKLTPQAYQPEILAAVVTPYVPRDDEPGRPLTAEWPGPALPGEAFNPDLKLSCVTVTGAQLDAVLAAAKTATANTPWVSGGNGYSVKFRPLLPEETGCADLKAAR